MEAAKREELQFDIRRVGRDRLGRFAELIRLSFGTVVDDSYFAWKYLQNPAGEVIAFEAIHGGTVAAFYGIIPETYACGGATMRVYQSMDTMTHPDYRRRGLFARLAASTYAAALEENGRLDMIGIPGRDSLPGFVGRLGWTCIHKFRYMFLPRWRHTITRHLRRPRDIELRQEALLGAEPAAWLDAQSQRAGGIRPLLNSHVFRWKVLNNPNRGFRWRVAWQRGKVVGIVVYNVLPDRRAMLHYVDVSDDVGVTAVVDSVVDEIFSLEAVSTVCTWEPQNDRLLKAYGGAGFIRNPFHRGPFSYRIPLIVRTSESDALAKDWMAAGAFDLQALMQD